MQMMLGLRFALASALAIHGVAQVFLPSEDVGLLVPVDGNSTGRRLQDATADYRAQAACLAPMVEFLTGLAQQHAAGKEITPQFKEELGKSIRDSVIKSVPLIAQAIGGPVGGVLGTLMASMVQAIVNPQPGDMWGRMQELFDQKQMRKELTDLDSQIGRRVVDLKEELQQLGASDGEQKKRILEKLDDDMRWTYGPRMFRQECIDLYNGRHKTAEREASCRRWRELGMHELGYVFAVFHLEILMELATWSDASPEYKEHKFTRAFDAAKEYLDLLTQAYQAYERKRVSWFKPPKQSGGLNCNIWTGKCMVYNGQDCMLSSDPKTCIKDGNSWPTDECTSKPIPGAERFCEWHSRCYYPACDVISNYCRVSGRVNPWENYLLGTHMYYWMLKQEKYDQVKACYTRYTRHIVRGLRRFHDKLNTLKTFAAARA